MPSSEPFDPLADGAERTAAVRPHPPVGVRTVPDELLDDDGYRV